MVRRTALDFDQARLYFRDPSGYVIELTAKTAEHDRAMDPATNGAREKLARWTASRR